MITGAVYCSYRLFLADLYYYLLERDDGFGDKALFLFYVYSSFWLLKLIIYPGR